MYYSHWKIAVLEVEYKLHDNGDLLVVRRDQQIDILVEAAPKVLGNYQLYQGCQL